MLKAVGQTAQLLFRPVLCEADARHEAKKPRRTRAYRPARRSTATTAANLAVNPSTGEPATNIPPDPAFADIKSTQPPYDNPKKDGPLAAARRQGGALRARTVGADG